MSHYRVDEAGEDDREDYVHGELGPLEHGAPYDGQRDRAEGDLEEELGRERNLRPREPRIHIIDLPRGNGEEPALRADERVARAEGQRKPESPEQQGGDRQID